MLRRAVLEAVPDRIVVRGAHLVRLQALEELALAERHAHVRAEELVRRAEEHVDVPARDVDPAVRAVVDGVRPGERAGAVRELDDPRHVRRRPDRVRRDRERDDARPLGELRLEVVEVEREIVVDAREADDDAEILLERQPRRHVRVVVEPRADDLVTALELSAERAREQEVERGHALPERDLVRMAGEEAAGGGAGALDQLDGADARLVRRADVRVVLAQVAGDRVDHLVRALRPAGPVEEGEPAVECACSARGRLGHPAGSCSCHFLSVDGPAVAGLRGQRGADEAVTLGLREQLARRSRERGRA